MTGLAVALWVEALKARRTLLVRLTMLGYLFYRWLAASSWSSSKTWTVRADLA
ncbi:MAG: hypothetical protein U0841_03905 [Chloroflexia bacterium]